MAALWISGHFTTSRRLVDSSSQGVHIYKLLTDVWQTSKCGIHLYYALGYGLPLLVVTLSILCNEALGLRGYDGNTVM